MFHKIFYIYDNKDRMRISSEGNSDIIFIEVLDGTFKTETAMMVNIEKLKEVVDVFYDLYSREVNREAK